MGLSGAKSIRTKAEFLAKSRAGLLGNHPHYWATVDEAREDGHTGTVAIRYAQPDSPFMRYDVPMDDIPGYIARCAEKGADPDLFYLNEQHLGGTRVLQGEAWRGIGGLYLNYSTLPDPMRVALERDGKHVEGVAAHVILRHFMDANSYDDLMGLMEMYPDDVVEFTTCDRPIGALADRNSIIWEVRGY